MAGSLKIHGLLYKFKDLDKTYSLNTPSPTERGELICLHQINGYIVKIGKPITIGVGKHTFKEIYGANKVEGTPKADIALVTFNSKTKKFENVCFISHKLGNSAADYQQYSGITEKADGEKAGSISKDKSVVDFLKTLSGFHKLVVDKKERFYRVLNDNKIVGKAIYGPLFGSKDYGIDNIHLIGQGDVKFTPSATKHVMRFTGHVSYNPDVSDFKKNDYTAIIGARYTSGRNYEVNGKIYSGARVLIMPKRLIGSKAKEI
jgi:hypothetical protein